MEINGKIVITVLENKSKLHVQASLIMKNCASALKIKSSTYETHFNFILKGVDL